jgi:hypothetical protein
MIDVKNIGFNMLLLLRTYQMTEAELAEEIESDRDLIRQGFMSEAEFEKKTNMQKLARELRRRDSLPSPEEAWLWSDFWGNIQDDKSSERKGG